MELETIDDFYNLTHPDTVYDLNGTDTYTELYKGGGMNGQALFQCIVYVIEAIIYMFITTAIASDRNRYQTTFWFTLLNFSVTYIPLNLLRYFGEVHIVIYPESNKSLCHLIHFLNSAVGDGGEMAIIPICLDLIVQNLMSERYENPKCRIFTLILIFVIWLLIIIKEIIFRKHSEIEFLCYQSNPPFVLWGDVLFTILRILMTLAAVGVLLYIARASGQPASQLVGLLGAPILVGFLLCFSSLLNTIYQAITLVNLQYPMALATGTYYFRLFCPMIIALLWLVDNNFRASIKRLVTCLTCRETGPQPTEHEMTTDIA